MINNPNHKFNESKEIELDRFSVISDRYFASNTDNYSDFTYSMSKRPSNKINSDKKEFLISDPIKVKKEIGHEINNFKGSLITMAATFVFSFNNLIGKVLGFYYPEVENAVTNLIRGIIICLIALFIIKAKQINLVQIFKSKPKNKTIILILRCFSGSIANFLFLQSLRHLRVSSAFTIFSVAPLIAGFLTVFFLKAKFNRLDVISFFICFFSLTLITKPAFVFSTAHMNNEDDKVGVLLCISGAVFSAFSIFLNKIISKDFDDELTTFLLGVFFIIEALFVIPFTQNGFATVSLLSLVLAVLIAVFYYIHISLFIVALRISNPIKILPINYFGVVLTLLYNVLIFRQSCDLFDILGSFFIIFVNVYKVCSQENQ